MSRASFLRRIDLSKNYITQIVEEVNSVTEHCGPVLLFGENIDTGSKLSGLARGLKVNPEGRILNVGNCELTHIGVGLGMMIDGGNAAVFMKQLDFLLLGLDQLVNTFNFIRSTRPRNQLGSFTVFLIICDQGYQGPQSSLNAAGDVASLGNVDIYCLNTAEEARSIVGAQFVSPGFRVICTSQRLFGTPALDIPIEMKAMDNSLFRYRSGDDVTIACYNFSLREGLRVAEQLSTLDIKSDVFHVNFVPEIGLEPLIESCSRTGALVLLDDSKTVTKFGDGLVTELHARDVKPAVLSLSRRGGQGVDYGVSEDQFVVDARSVLDFLEGIRFQVVAG